MPLRPCRLLHRNLSTCTPIRTRSPIFCQFPGPLRKLAVQVSCSIVKSFVVQPKWLGARAVHTPQRCQDIQSDFFDFSPTDNGADTYRTSSSLWQRSGRRKVMSRPQVRGWKGIIRLKFNGRITNSRFGRAWHIDKRTKKRYLTRRDRQGAGFKKTSKISVSKTSISNRRISKRIGSRQGRNAVQISTPKQASNTLNTLGFKTLRFRPRFTRYSSILGEAWRRRPVQTKATRIEKWIVHSQSMKLVRQRWSSLSSRRRSRIWASLITHTMSSESCSTLVRLLLGTYTQPLPPSLMVSGVVDYIIRKCIPPKPKQADPNNSRLLLDLIHLLWKLGPRTHLKLRQTSIHLLISNLSQGTANDFLNDLIEQQQTFSPITLSLFAHRLAKSGDISDALKIVKTARLDGHGLGHHSGVSGLWTTFLQRKHRREDQTVSDYDIISAMRSSEVKQNIYHYNVLLRNALQDGDLATGQQLYKMMSSSEIGVDAATYSILLNDAKCRMDRSAIEQILRTVKDKRIKSAYIVTDLLHIVFNLHRQEQKDMINSSKQSSQSAFERMVPIFSTYHNCDFLRCLVPTFDFDQYYGHLVGARTLASNAKSPESLEISTQQASSAILSQSKMTDPAPPSLSVMMAGLLEGAHLTQVRKIFTNFYNLVIAGDSCVAGLSDTSHVYNYFLMAFGKHLGGVTDCINLMELMLSSESVRNRMELARSMNTRSATNRSWHRPAVKAGPTFRREIPSFAVVIQEAETLQPLEKSPHIHAPRELPKRSLKTLQLGQISHRARTVQKPIPKPCIYTWSILLDVFMRHSQPLAAEKVLNLMLARDIKPSIITWEKLISGYSRMQDPAMTADAVYRMEQAGFEKTDRINVALAVVKDRERYWREVSQRRAQGQVDRMMDEVLEGAVRGRENPADF